MKAIIQSIASQLQTVYPAEEAEALAWWVAEEVTGLSRTQLLCGCKGTKNIPNTQDIIERLLHFEPIQYIFGHTFWCGLDLKVTPATLIPRPETGELVEKLSVVSRQPSAPSLRVLDIGTGSGCIAIALKKRHPEWQVTGIDISAEAIEVARENARRNDAEVDFQVADIFSVAKGKDCSDETGVNRLFDLVVSNPPYICEKEKKDMRRNVLDYEPATALFVPDEDPLRFYRRIAELRWGKQLFFEINEAYADEMQAMLAAQGYAEIQVMEDSYGKPRIISCRMAE